MSKVVFATASKTRLAMLAAAGVTCEGIAAPVDENEIKRSLQGEGASSQDAAEALAEIKALHVSRRHPDALVFGADQMLDCNGVWFDKPADMDHARAHLRALRGHTHELISAVVCVQNGKRIWHEIDRARLTMRPFSDDFLEEYLGREGAEILSSVGAYRLEGLGAQLFTRIQGDHFTILGLPLLPVLDFLRAHGVLKS